MRVSDDAARRYRQEAETWGRVAQAIGDARRRMYWQRFADDYAALAAKLESTTGPSVTDAAE